MSFDLCVWFEPEPVTDEQAAATYRSLCEVTAATAPAHPAVVAFHHELTGQFPEIGTSPEIGAAPWTADLSTTATSVLMPIAWSRANEVKLVVRELAERHGLVCHNPQTGDTDQPVPPSPALTLSSHEDGRTVQPDWTRIEATLRRLSSDNWFAILERGEGRFVQAGFGDKAGTAHGWYLVERREGAADQHYRTTQSDLDEVIAAFRQFAEDDEHWQRRFNWRTIDA